MSRFFLLFLSVAVMVSACGRKPFDPAEVDPVRNSVSNGVETIGLESDPDHNARVNIPLPAWIVSDLASRPRPKIAASDSGVAGLDSVIFVTINNLSKRSVRTVYLAIDLANAIASASVNLEVGATVFQAFYKDRDGIIIYQSKGIVATIEKGRPYQITLKMERAPVAQANINVAWDTTSAAIGESVIIPRPPPPPLPNLTLQQLVSNAYYVFDGRQRLEFFIEVAMTAAEGNVDLEALDFKVVGSLSRFQVDTLVVFEKLDKDTSRLLLKIQGSPFFGAITAGKLRLAMTIPRDSTKTLQVGGIIARAIDLSELVNQSIGFSITGVGVKYPAVVSTRLPLGQAVTLSFVPENQPRLLPRL